MYSYFTAGYHHMLQKLAFAPAGPKLAPVKPVKPPTITAAKGITEGVLADPTHSATITQENMASARDRIQNKFSEDGYPVASGTDQRGWASSPPDNVLREWGIRQPFSNESSMHSGRKVSNGFQSVDNPTLALHGDISGMGNEDRGAP